MPTLTAVLHLFAAGLFVAMAVLQLNDPDPLYWVVVYLLVACVPLGRLCGWESSIFRALVAGLLLAGLLQSLPGFVDYLTSDDLVSLTGAMNPALPFIESAREFIGLLLGAICLLVYSGVDRSPKR
ncbi:MAG: transmembrane 220 family protein [Pseudomonadota bacterium]